MSEAETCAPSAIGLGVCLAPQVISKNLESVPPVSLEPSQVVLSDTVIADIGRDITDAERAVIRRHTKRSHPLWIVRRHDAMGNVAVHCLEIAVVVSLVCEQEIGVTFESL